VTIDLSSSDTTEGTVSPTSVTFDSLNWNAAQVVTVTGVDDAIADGDVAYSVLTGTAVSSDGNYNSLNAADVAVSNVDNDIAGITVSAISGDTTEAGGTATFSVVLDTEPTGNVKIDLSSSDASEGTVSPASVTFTAANWNVAQVVTVTGVDDAIADGDLTFSVLTAAAVSTDNNYDGLNAADVGVTNDDNDVAGITVSAISGNTSETGTTATFSVVLNTEPTSDVTIDLSSSDTSEGAVSPSSVTFTAANWDVAQVVTVTGVDDTIADGDVAYSILTADAVSSDGNYNGLNVADVAVTNVDNDTAGITVSAISGNTSENGTTATFSVVLNTEPTDPVTIDLSSSDTSEGTVSPASVTFDSSNWNVAQVVTVTGVDDAIADGNVAYSILTAAAVSSDGNYNGLNAADVAVTNVDSDTTALTLNIAPLSISENGGSATGTITRNDADLSTALVVNLSSSDTTEATVPATVIILAGQSSVDFTITAVDDAVDDGTQVLSISATATGYVGYSAGLNVTDDDNPALTLSVSPVSISENGGSATGTITRNNADLSAALVVNLASSDTTEATVPATVTILAGQSSVDFTIIAVDDAVDDGTQVLSISATATGYTGNSAGLNVTDDDNPALTLSVTFRPAE